MAPPGAHRRLSARCSRSARGKVAQMDQQAPASARVSRTVLPSGSPSIATAACLLTIASVWRGACVQRQW